MLSRYVFIEAGNYHVTDPRKWYAYERIMAFLGGQR